ncbi:unnamed protein product [Echinostoma caproni]|uniref:Glycoside hydrolase family 19 catalytic domain-containing protein n=1 Tax=Echinostoma caproni TaxID=27848 RepID=A0A3P8H2M5_9TREM|nr:unnamed protein product [Echinostoma caproni]
MQRANKSTRICRLPTKTVCNMIDKPNIMITRHQWETIFPERWGVGQHWKDNYPYTLGFYPEMQFDYYSYENFCAAVQAMSYRGFDNFCSEPKASREDNRRELAAFLAHISFETSEGMHALYHREEEQHEQYQSGSIELYRDVAKTNYKMSDSPVYYPLGHRRAEQLKFNRQSYHGRGPVQLRWAYNYGKFSEVAFGNPNILLNKPDMLLEDGKLGFMSAIWYWTTTPKNVVTPHDYMHDHRTKFGYCGFGHTIAAMNEDFEQNAAEFGPYVRDRVVFFRRCAEVLGVPVGRFTIAHLDTMGICEFHNLSLGGDRFRTESSTCATF